MNIGLIDVDGHNFPNLPLMKISAWHKAQGDHVEWYELLKSDRLDIVYMSKVFTFSPDYKWYVDANKVIKSGTGYAISLVDGKEVYDKSKDIPLPEEIEHIYPDYSLYPDQTKDTAYGFLTRGCPRGCSFCHVKPKEGGSRIKWLTSRSFGMVKNISNFLTQIFSLVPTGKTYFNRLSTVRLG